MSPILILFMLVIWDLVPMFVVLESFADECAWQASWLQNNLAMEICGPLDGEI